MASPVEEYITNGRGQKLYTATFRPKRAVARLVWAHGLAEHCRRCDAAFGRLASAGVEVVALDMHNHGRSESLVTLERAYIGSFDHLLDDLDAVVANVDKGDVPLFIGGQSMGALAACLFVLKAGDSRKFAGLVMHSPCLDVEWTLSLTIQSYIGRLLGWLAPHARVVAAVRPQDMSQDEAVLEERLKDKLITHGPTCARSACEILDNFVALSYGGKAKELTLPFYIGHGTMDKCTSLPASRRFMKLHSSSDATLFEFEGGYHELLLGPEKEDASDRIAVWIKARV